MNSAIDMTQSDSEDTPPGQLNEEDLIAELTSYLKDGRKHWAKWRTEARKCYDFFAGDQWDGEDKKKLEDEMRPVVTFNRCPRTINGVAGLELQNRQEIRCNAREKGDAAVSDVLNAALKWARDNCDAENEESEMFQDCLMTGVGWVGTRMEYEEEPEGQIIEERIDPLEMMVDPNSKKRNFADAKWVARIRQMTRREFNANWPNTKDIQPNLFWQDNDSNDEHDATQAPFYNNDQSDKLSQFKNYTVAQIQWWDKVPIVRVVDPQNAKTIEMDPHKFEMTSQIMAMQGIQLHSVQGHKRVYKQAFLSGNKLLEPVQELGCPHFTFQSTTGLRDRNQGVWFGLIRVMMDPQMWANKWMSQIQHIINTGAKNGLIAEQSAITNQSKFEENFAKPGSISIVNDGALSQGKIIQKEPPRFPEGVDRLLQYALNAINDVTGVNLELIGMADRDQPIGLEESRKKAGVMVLANFFDSLRLFRKVEGRILCYYIREYIADGRLVRIVGDEGAQYVPLLKDELTYKYDIVVDDAPSSPNMKERVFMILSQMLPMLLPAGIPIPPDVLDYAPIPEVLAQKWKQMIAQKAQDPMNEFMKQIQAQLAQLGIDEKQADIRKVESETAKNYADADHSEALGKYESVQMMQKLGMAENEHSIEMDNVMRDQQRKTLEMILNQGRKMQEAKSNMAIKRMQANNS